MRLPGRCLHVGLLSEAGLPNQRFHDLRHAFATPQLEAGADVFEVSRAPGHARISTTANTYGHFTRAMAERSADRMTWIIGKPASGRWYGLWYGGQNMALPDIREGHLVRETVVSPQRFEL